jgi:5-methylcytosine-specific restriction enzyme A
MFVPGQEYRRRDLHESFGGQAQSGISTPKSNPFIFLFTGQTGEQYGYQDGFQSDGTYWYTDEGQVGDMQMVRGNLALRDHEANGKVLQLFEYVGPGRLEYMGEAVYLGHHEHEASDRNGNARRAIIFELALDAPAEGVASSGAGEPAREGAAGLWRRPLDRLRAVALATPPAGASAKVRSVNVYT